MTPDQILTCDQALELIPLLQDGELDHATVEAVRAHAETCEACRVAIQTQTALATALKTELESERLSPELRHRIREATVGRPRRNPWPLVLTFAAGWAFGLALFLVWPKAADDRFAAELRETHVRALAGIPFQVASESRHTVKPWFQGKLPFAPSVPDLSPDFQLVGGRLDSLEGHTTAVLVYKRGLHFIDVYVLDRRPDPREAFATKGFNVAHFAIADLDYWAITDGERAGLSEFVQGFKSKEGLKQ